MHTHTRFPAVPACTSAGARVAIVELPMAFLSSANKGGVGGTCVMRGCVPKKLLLFATEFNTEIQSAKGFGWVE